MKLLSMKFYSGFGMLEYVGRDNFCIILLTDGYITSDIVVFVNVLKLQHVRYVKYVLIFFIYWFDDTESLYKCS
jgi:hypothetical protein